MPFCEACGTEITPGKNFCSRCGAPLAMPGTLPPPSPPEPGVPPAPLPASPQPLPLSPAPGQSRDKLIIAGIMGAAILGIIIFIGLPLIQSPGSGSNSLLATTPSSTGTPAGSGFTPVTTLSYGAGAASSGTTVYRSGIPYELVFSKDYDSMAQDVFSYNLQQSPMIIECEMNPKMVTREKLVDIGESSERYITTTYGDPNAWLDLKVVNTDTGKTETTISFSKNYVGMTKQEYTLRANGNYRFEITGNLVSPSVRLLVKK
jgi:hypothetical protein